MGFCKLRDWFLSALLQHLRVRAIPNGNQVVLQQVNFLPKFLRFLVR